MLNSMNIYELYFGIVMFGVMIGLMGILGIVKIEGMLQVNLSVYYFVWFDFGINVWVVVVGIMGYVLIGLGWFNVLGKQLYFSDWKDVQVV